MNSFNDVRLENMIAHRPNFPKRAMITSGMPNGNKFLHIGHAMMWVHTDIFARFMRDRIGYDNVLHVSGTDSFGSPVEEGYRKAVEAGEFKGTIKEFALSKRMFQKQTFEEYQIGINLYSGSCLDEAVPLHEETGAWLFNTLRKNGFLNKLSTSQFYDEKLGVLLNGRQVIGKCPIEGCQGEKGYADECDLGHQYMPSQLIDPVSVLSGERPMLKKIDNWYFDLQNHTELLKDWIDYLKKNTKTRENIIKTVEEFLKKPEIYIKKEFESQFNKIKYQLPPFEYKDDTKASFTIVFDKLEDREATCDILTAAGINYRTGKTLVPFRLTGNCKWGLKCPQEAGENLTFWVWPESLWAPITFTKQWLISQGRPKEDWRKYWCDKDCKVYQFIGEDNIYFYGPAQTAMWFCTQGKNPTVNVPDGDLTIPQIVSDKHLLFLGKKAGSSSAVKAPLAHELLNFYTPEQLRMHFLGMNVINNPASIFPKPLNPDADPNEVDPVVREGNLLTNVFNRVLRNLCYTWQKDFDGYMPFGTPDEEIVKEGELSLLKYEKLMSEQKLHMVSYELDTYIRNINKYWVKYSSEFENNRELEKQVIVNTLHMVRVAMLELHPVVPVGIENLAEFMGINKDIFKWENEDKLIYDFIESPEHHKPKFLNPREDFFVKHPSQFETEE